MKIAIINDVHVGPPLKGHGIIRSHSDLVMEKFESFLRNLNERHNPDLIVNLGDLIRSENREIDLNRYKQMIAHYSVLQTPVIHLMGNHEIKQLEPCDIEKVWCQYGFNQTSYGFRSFDEIDILWLGIEKDKNSRQLQLPSEQLDWLKNTLNYITKPFMVFIHLSLDDHDVTGNFFYEALDQRKKDILFLKNHKEVRDVLHSKHNFVAVFQAHLHYFHARLINKVPYITCPAMNDNICAPDIVNNIPEIYTIARWEGGQLTAKAYSREFCFAGFEINLFQ